METQEEIMNYVMSYGRYLESIKKDIKIYSFDFINTKQSIPKEVYKQYLKVCQNEPDRLIEIKNIPQTYLNKYNNGYKYNNGNPMYLPKVLMYNIIVCYFLKLHSNNDDEKNSEWYYDKILFYYKDYTNKINN